MSDMEICRQLTWYAIDWERKKAERYHCPNADTSARVAEMELCQLLCFLVGRTSGTYWIRLEKMGAGTKSTDRYG